MNLGWTIVSSALEMEDWNLENTTERERKREREREREREGERERDRKRDTERDRQKGGIDRTLNGRVS